MAGRGFWSADVKEQCAVLAEQGKSFREISEETGVPHQTIASWGIQTRSDARELPVPRERRAGEAFTDDDKEQIMAMIMVHRLSVAEIAKHFNCGPQRIYEMKSSDDPLIIKLRQQYIRDSLDRIYGGLPGLIDRTFRAAVGDAMQGAIAVEKLTNAAIMLENGANMVQTDSGKKTLADLIRVMRETRENQPRHIGQAVVDSTARPALHNGKEGR